MSNPEVRALIEAGVTAAATAAGLPVLVIPVLVDAFETLAGSHDPLSAAERIKQNLLADSQDAAAVAAADQIIKHTGKPIY